MLEAQSRIGGWTPRGTLTLKYVSPDTRSGFKLATGGRSLLVQVAPLSIINTTSVNQHTYQRKSVMRMRSIQLQRNQFIETKDLQSTSTTQSISKIQPGAVDFSPQWVDFGSG